MIMDRRPRRSRIRGRRSPSGRQPSPSDRPCWRGPAEGPAGPRGSSPSRLLRTGWLVRWCSRSSGVQGWRPLWLLAYAFVFAWPLVPTWSVLSVSSRRARLIAWPIYLAAAAGLLALARPANLLDVVLLIFPVVFVAATSAKSLRGAAWLVAPVLLMIGVTVNAWRLVARYFRFEAPFDGFAWGAVVVGSVLPIVALGYVWLTARLYRSKWTSDPTLLIVQWWFVSSLWWMMLLGVQGGAAWLLSGHAVRALHGGACGRSRIPPPGRGVRLLLLRTFGARGRSTRLVSVLARQWRWIGSVELITAPDVASETLEPDEFLDFPLRRLSRRSRRRRGGRAGPARRARSRTGSGWSVPGERADVHR